MPAVAEVEQALVRLWNVPAGLRDEDRKKCHEVAPLLDEVARIGRRQLVIDAAAGHAYVGLLAAELLGVRQLVVIERDERRANRAREAAARLSRPTAVEVRTGDVADAGLWPEAPDLVLGLHACGPASDLILDAATRAGARWLLLVPCCYAHVVPFSPVAEAHARSLGVTHGEVRRRLVTALIDAERTLRLEAAGYDVTVVPFVAPTVTPHNLLWRARRAGEPNRMSAARASLTSLPGRLS